MKMYGIPNCDTIKKAKKFLDQKGIEFEFHDYKKQGVPEADLGNWVKQVGWEVLLNRRGTTWRKLPDEIKTNIDQESAISVMIDNPSVIKRPVLVNKGSILVGFNEDEYSSLSN